MRREALFSMDFQGASTYLLSAINETASRRLPGRLERMQAFLDALGSPQDAYPTMHVGGTSGKGSTATMMASALNAAGKRCGLHTKPHLISMTERMKIDGTAISEEEFADILSEMLSAIDRVTPEHGRPTYYETLLAMSFMYFARQKVDIAVIEVGIGGTFDGTNVLRPLVAAITNVGLDHVEILGDTIEAIAFDKAGIAKEGVPLVSAAQEPARSIIAAQCALRRAPFYSVNDLVSVRPREGQRYGQSFIVQTPSDTYDVSLRILGDFQQRNAATAILALEMLPENLRPAREAIERGLSELVLMGRMEFYPSHPAVVFDIAHNPAKAQALADALRSTFVDRRFAFVVAVGEGKDAFEMLRIWAELPATFVFTTFEVAGRTVTRPTRLQSMMEQSLGHWGRAVNDSVEALEIARRHADASDVVVVTGSTYIVATLREWWLDNVGSRTT